MNKKQILIIAPSLSPALAPKSVYLRATINLERYGYNVCWAPNARRALENSSKNRFGSIPLQEKIEDIYWSVKQPGYIILTALGGFDSYQLLDKVPFSQLADKKKILVGHSDPTLILNTYYAKTGGIAWYGSNLRNLGDKETGIKATQNFTKAISSETQILRKSSIYKDNFQAPLRKVRNWTIIQPGVASGVGIGGNIGSLYLLQGTPYMPRFNQSTILFLEEDDMPGLNTINEFDRRLRSLLDQAGASKNVQGLLLGRFLDTANVTATDIKVVIQGIDALKNKPVIANMEFGHGMPRIMLPIGGRISIDTKEPSIATSSK